MKDCAFPSEQREKALADKRDYYEVLGIQKGASDADIKSAFRKKAKNCHPDLHPGDKAKEAEFKELNEAYEILSDPDKRAKYDQFGFAAFDPSMGGGQGPFGGGAGFGGFDFSDIIDSVFGGGGFRSGGFDGFGGSSRTRNGPVPGNDLRYSITLTLEEAASGIKKEILIPRGDVELCEGDRLILGADLYDVDTDLRLKEIELKAQHEWTGQKIKDLDISRKSFIVTVRRGNETIIPRGNLRLREGDLVILYTKQRTDEVYMQ